MPQPPELSIIIPSYNAAATIAATLDSIVVQNFLDLEVLVMDGLSTDNTCDLVRAYVEQYPWIKLYIQQDKGVYDAMNSGIKKAAGTYLYFMGSDDVFYTPNSLRDFMRAIDPKAHFIYGNVIFKHSKQIYSGPSSIERLIYQQVSVCHQAIIYKSELFERLGLYNLDYFVHADYDFNIRCFRAKEVQLQFIDQILAVFNETGISGSQSNKDHFHTHLTEQNIRDRQDVVKLFYENQRLKELLKGLKKSPDYRLGNLLLKPLRLLKKLFKS